MASPFSGRANRDVNKRPVRVVADTNVALSGTQTIDGVVLGVGDRVLCIGQTTGSENGIYVVAAAAWARSGDFNHANNVVPGGAIPVAEGGRYRGQTFRLNNTLPIAVDTDTLTFLQDDSGTFNKRAGFDYTYNFFDGPGGTATLPWLAEDQVSAAGALTLDFNGGAFGGFNIATDATDEAQEGSMTFNDDLLLVPVSGNGMVVEWGFIWTPAGAAGAATTDFVVGLGDTRGAGAQVLNDLVLNLWVRVDGANMDILVQGDDGVLDSSFDSGLDIIKGNMTRVRFDMNNLAAVVVSIDLGDGVGWRRLATTVDVTNMTAVQPYAELQKSGGTQVESLVLKYFHCRADLPLP